MPLPPATASRTPQHVRQVEVQAYRRDDGLWDLDAHLRDTRRYEVSLRSGPRAAGEPIHDMWLRVTIDLQLQVVDAVAEYEAVPYPGTCDAIAPDYRKLIGLNLGRDFRKQVHARLGATRGCAHLTELAQILPTAAIQALSTARGGVDTRGNTPSQVARPPSQIDRCHALARDGETVREHYPQWYVPPRKD